MTLQDRQARLIDLRGEDTGSGWIRRPGEHEKQGLKVAISAISAYVTVDSTTYVVDRRDLPAAWGHADRRHQTQDRVDRRDHLSNTHRGRMKNGRHTTFITDWRPDATPQIMPPGAEHEISIAPQNNVILRGVFVPALRLGRLRIGSVETPFETISDLPPRIYRPKITEQIAKQLLAIGVLEVASLKIPAALFITVTLRNESASAVKPRAALIVLAKVS